MKERLEEAAINCWAEGAWDNRDDFTDGFIEGAKSDVAKEYWFEKLQQEQAKKMYSEEEVMDMFDKFSMYLPLHYEFLVKEQFKKK